MEIYRSSAENNIFLAGYRGGPVTKKVGNAKKQFTCFSVFRYSKPFGAHATSNVCIYFRQKPFYGHPIGDSRISVTKKIDNPKIQKTWEPGSEKKLHSHGQILHF